MLLLTAPFDPSRAAASPFPWPAAVEIAAGTLTVLAAGLALERAGNPFGSALGGGAVHAGFLALGWALVEGSPHWRPPALRLAAVVLAASLASRIARVGALAYLLVPVALMFEAARRPVVARIGFVWPRWAAAAVGLGAGIVLSAHLLLASSLTLGYTVRLEAPGHYVAAIAYDAGLSAVTAEWLFRGALFSRLWRSWAFGPAAALSTALVVIRYVLDANLSSAVEVWLGAVFYTGLLGVTACALRAWSGSLLPGYVATLVFFLGYRALGH